MALDLLRCGYIYCSLVTLVGIQFGLFKTYYDICLRRQNMIQNNITE